MLRPILGAAAFVVVALGGGLWLGGAYALGRHDALLAVPTLLAFTLMFFALLPRHHGAIAAVAATTMMLVAGVVLGAAAKSAAVLSVAVIMALSLAWLLVHRTAALARPQSWVLLVAAVALWWIGSHLLLARGAVPAVAAQSGRLVVVTGLPLVQWNAEDAISGPCEDAALAALRAGVARPLTMSDTLDSGMLRPGDRLLLAHPRALDPAALVEIDRFVRAGGRAVVLADGLSAWPPPHALGDARNPPVTSLLTPLLDHWGIGLAAPVPGSLAAEAVTVIHRGYRLRLHSAGHFDRLPRACRVEAGLVPGQPMLAVCQIGRGEAVVLADADLLFAPLWQSDPAWARHLRPSDNIEWVADLLNR